MRSKSRRLLLGLGIVIAAPLLSTLRPTPAHAGTCYTVEAGPQSFAVCP